MLEGALFPDALTIVPLPFVQEFHVVFFFFCFIIFVLKLCIVFRFALLASIVNGNVS